MCAQLGTMVASKGTTDISRMTTQNGYISPSRSFRKTRLKSKVAKLIILNITDNTNRLIIKLNIVLHHLYQLLSDAISRRIAAMSASLTRPLS